MSWTCELHQTPTTQKNLTGWFFYVHQLTFIFLCHKGWFLYNPIKPIKTDVLLLTAAPIIRTNTSTLPHFTPAWHLSIRLRDKDAQMLRRFTLFRKARIQHYRALYCICLKQMKTFQNLQWTQFASITCMKSCEITALSNTVWLFMWRAKQTHNASDDSTCFGLCSVSLQEAMTRRFSLKWNLKANLRRCCSVSGFSIFSEVF